MQSIFPKTVVCPHEEYFNSSPSSSCNEKTTDLARNCWTIISSGKRFQNFHIDSLLPIQTVTCQIRLNMSSPNKSCWHIKWERIFWRNRAKMERLMICGCKSSNLHLEGWMAEFCKIDSVELCENTTWKIQQQHSWDQEWEFLITVHLLAPQSGALRISAYRDFQSNPIHL